ncbi:MAG: hypothetical protein JW775_05145, partial [Candidatus Aminicenantes bacterium]|nr:hypothetical protein [Candidatus Aminicenantes bacterium]
MNRFDRYRSWAACACLALVIVLAGGCASQESQNKIHYALEMNGQVFGYVELSVANIEDGERSLIQLKEAVANRYTALGVPVDTEGWSEQRVDPETGRLVFIEQAIGSSGLEVHITASIDGNEARIDLQPGGREKAVPLPDGVLIENQYYFPLEKAGRIAPGPKVHRALDLLDRNIHNVRVTKRGPESVEIGGKEYQAIVVDFFDLDIGLKIRQWIDAENGYLLKSEGPRSVQRIADRSMKNRLQRVDIDNHLFAQVGVAITDIPA